MFFFTVFLVLYLTLCLTGCWPCEILFSLTFSRQMQEAAGSHKVFIMQKFVKIVLCLVFSFFFHSAFAACAVESMAVEDTDGIDVVDSDNQWKPVIDALIQVESNGKSNAVKGASVGVLQITPVLVAECNNILKKRKSKKRFKLSDRFSKKKSIEMFLLFQSWFNPMHNIEQAIRSWNGGMHYSVAKTQKYFDKVMSILQGK